MDATGLDGLTPETLTEENATRAWEALRDRAKARHNSEEVRGRLSLQGFCICGHSSMGNGGALCRQLRELAKGGDEGEWLKKARALRDALAGRTGA
ncbi:MAG: hypothetical protein R3A48_28730 [Polyangiales bacterium]